MSVECFFSSSLTSSLSLSSSVSSSNMISSAFSMNLSMGTVIFTTPLEVRFSDTFLASIGTHDLGTLILFLYKGEKSYISAPHDRFIQLPLVLCACAGHSPGKYLSPFGQI